MGAMTLARRRALNPPHKEDPNPEAEPSREKVPEVDKELGQRSPGTDPPRKEGTPSSTDPERWTIGTSAVRESVAATNGWRDERAVGPLRQSQRGTGHREIDHL